MFKSVTIALTLAALTLTTPAASAAPSKVSVELGGKTTTLSRSQIRAEHPKMFTAYRKAQRAGKAYAANPDGPVPLGCVRFPWMIVCNHAGYWCAWSGGEIKFNCGGGGSSSSTASRSLRLN